MEPSPSAAARRAAAIARHLAAFPLGAAAAAALEASPCLSYAPPESIEPPRAFSSTEFRALLDGHHLRDRDWVFGAMEESPLFCPRRSGGGGKVFVSPDYNEGKEGQREATMRRVGYLARRGVFRGWLTEPGPDAELRKLALLECLGIYDHSLAIKIGVHFFLWRALDRNAKDTRVLHASKLAATAEPRRTASADRRWRRLGRGSVRNRAGAAGPVAASVSGAGAAVAERRFGMASRGVVREPAEAAQSVVAAAQENQRARQQVGPTAAASWSGGGVRVAKRPGRSGSRRKAAVVEVGARLEAACKAEQRGV